MAFEIRIPRLGWSMEEGTFIGWKKHEGEAVRAGEPLFELEGEKAAQDIESVDEGVLRIPPDAPSPGTVVAVGRVIGVLVGPGETPPWETQGASAAGAVQAAIAEATAAGAAAVGAMAAAAAPSVRRLARELHVDLDRLAAVVGTGRITADDVRAAAQGGANRLREAAAGLVDAVAQAVAPAASGAPARLRSTPRARRAAKQRGLDLARMEGTGRDGRIRERDVLAAAPETRASSAKTGSIPAGDRAARSTSPQSTGPQLTSPQSSLRRTIASRLKRSQNETVPVTLHTRVDASNLVSLREQFKAQGRGGEQDAVVPSYTDLTLKLCAAVLAQQPQFAACWREGQLVLPESLDLGVAVDTNEGLVVPVVRGVERLRLADLARTTADLVARARNRQLRLDELQGGVFTVTNLGGFGIEGFTPVIHWPETTILGLGAIRREAVVGVDDRIEPRWQMMLSLTFDHCAVDGAPAARFLQTVRTALENPAAWLLG
ncbi:MAG: 2-oxo acid dehydrogenase subunit E2 [Pirellulales bacterium]